MNKIYQLQPINGSLDKLLLSLYFLVASFTAILAQTPIGTWKTINDLDHKAESYIEIYEQDGELFGKVTKILTATPDKRCINCSGDRKDQPVVGMVFLEGLRPHKDYWSYGRVLDPGGGNWYKCNLFMEGPDKLKIRGYIGFPALGRTQYWYRL